MAHANPEGQGGQQADVAQRLVEMPDGTVINNKQPAANFLLGDHSLGYTPPTLNDVEIGGDAAGKSAAQQATAAPGIHGRPSTSLFGGFDAWVSNVPVNRVSFTMYLPAPPPWTAPTAKDYAAGLLSPNAYQCRDQVGDTTFAVCGQPDDNRLVQDVETHERFHVADHIRVTQQTLQPWDTKLQKAMNPRQMFRADTAEAAEEKLYRAMGGRPDQIAARLHEGWGTASDRFHETPQGKTNIHSAGAAEDCSTSYVRITVP